MDDRSLIAAYLAGSAPAVARITAWIERATAGFRRPLGADWEDAIQDVQVELLRSFEAERFAGTGSLEAFVSRVARFRVIDRLRRRSLVQWVDVEAVAPFLEERGAAAAVTQGDALSPLLRLYAAMPEGCRRLWRLIVAGYSYREMSFALGVAEGTLRVRVKRCRDKAVAERERKREVTSSRDGSTRGARQEPRRYETRSSDAEPESNERE